MGEIALVMAQSGVGVVNVPGIAFTLVSIAFLVLVWHVIHRIQRWFGRSLKAQQHLARAAADMTERLERIENKLEARDQAKE